MCVFWYTLSRRLRRRKPRCRSYRLGTGRALAVLPTLNRIVFSVYSLHVFYRNPDSFIGSNVCLRKARPFGRVFRLAFEPVCQGLDRVRVPKARAHFMSSRKQVARIIARQGLFQFQLCEEVDMSWEKEGLMLVFCCEKLICHFAVGRRVNDTI